MNFRTDVIVVGDSKTGHEILDKIAKKSSIEVAFISQAFKSTTTHDYVNVKYFRDEVEYVSFRYGLFCCSTKNRDNIFGTHLVIASGLNYEPLVINGEQIPNVFNTADDISELAEDQSALVICNQDSDAKLAVEAAKKYNQVYLCTNTLNLTDFTSASVVKKLSKAENVTILPNTSVKRVVSDGGELQKVELDNYSEIVCSAIFTKTSSKPAIDFIPKKILSREDGFPLVEDNCESTLVPKCFIAGSCLKKYTKAMENNLVASILKDF